MLTNFIAVLHVNNSLIRHVVSTIIDLRFFAIYQTTLLQSPYRRPPSIENIFTRASFFSLFLSFLSHNFSWACGSLRELA